VFLGILLVLVHWGSFNKPPFTEWFIKSRNVFLMVLEAGKSISRCWWIHCLVVPVAWFIDGSCLLCPYIKVKGKAALWGLSYNDIKPAIADNGEM
jgi:hypothetical protein